MVKIWLPGELNEVSSDLCIIDTKLLVEWFNVDIKISGMIM